MSGYYNRKNRHKSKKNNPIITNDKNKNNNNNEYSSPCPYCKGKILIKNAEDVFKDKTHEPLKGKQLYICENFPHCNSYVVKSKRPQIQGPVASDKLRKLRQTTHYYFDIIWKTKIITKRTVAYEWLADKLKINISKCHIGMFNENLCNKAKKFCSEYILENIANIKTFSELNEFEINALKKLIFTEKKEIEKIKRKSKKNNIKNKNISNNRY